MSNPLDNFSAPGGDYMKFKIVGDEITGTLQRVETGKNYDGDADVPVLVMATAEGERKVSCENANLLRKVLEPGIKERLIPGATFTIRHTGVDQANRGMKLYDVLFAGVADAAPAAPQAPAAQAGVAPPPNPLA